jgi:hypothetical protein
LLAIDDQLMRAHLSLTELLSRQISHASIQFKLQLTASAYILNPLCPYYSSFTKQPTDFPYYLKAFLKNDAAIRLFEEYLELEMSKMLGRFLVNFNQGLCDNALAQKVFKTDSITKDHLRRLKMMTMMPSIGFYDELNLYIAAGGGIHEGESAPDYIDKQLGDFPLATINFDAESPFPSQ